MKIDRIADKSRPDYVIRRIKAVEDDVARLRTARSVNASEVDGALTVAGNVNVTSGGVLTINKAGGTTIEASSTKDGYGNLSAQLVFHSRFGDGSQAAAVSLQDGGNPYSSLVTQSSKTSDNKQALLSLTPALSSLVSQSGAASVVLTQDPTQMLAWFAFKTGTGESDVNIAGSYIEFPNGRLTSANVPEFQVRAIGGASYIPIRASSFPLSSSRKVKTDIQAVPFDSVAAIVGAPVSQWRYAPGHATESVTHVGPMAEDLPADLVHPDSDGVASVDLLSLVGTLWDAVGKLAARVQALESAAGHPAGPPAAPPVTK